MGVWLVGCVRERLNMRWFRTFPFALSPFAFHVENLVSSTAVAGVLQLTEANDGYCSFPPPLQLHPVMHPTWYQ